MKKIIEESGLKLKEFANLYNIPYNTVRQWYNEKRKCPEYIKSMILQIRELKSKGEKNETKRM